jgi:membrane fusion protein (multidrug efflux system)
VEAGEWHGDDWFITQGLKPGERVVVDGAIRVVADTPLKIVASPTPGAANDAPADDSNGSKAGPSKTMASK